MRKLILLGWLLIPLVALAYHKGPGQRKMRLDQIDRILAQAEEHAASEEWSEAELKYEDALDRLPQDLVNQRRRVRLERAKAQMLARKLPDAHQDLKGLVDEMKEDENADQDLLDETRATLANSQYYLTWLMRLEGQPEEKWKPEIEAARQTFRLLAEKSETAGDDASKKRNQEDLESAIRLARMDLSELQGLPLPSQ